MSDGRPTVLLAIERDDTRRARDRRAKARRAPHRPLDPLFAATLVNQIAVPEAVFTPASYPPQRGPRAGIAFDVSA
jgi:hypothetical protein